MQRFMVYPLALLSLVFMAFSALAADPLVTIDWVKANLGKPGIVLLDVTSGGGRTEDEFAKQAGDCIAGRDERRWPH